MGGQVWMLDESFQTQIVGFRREVSHSRPPVLENFDHIVGPQFSQKKIQRSGQISLLPSFSHRIVQISLPSLFP